MSRSNAFVVKGIEPRGDPAYALAGEAVHRMFWGWVRELVLQAKDMELARGLDRFGKPLARLKASTIAHRHSEMGPADPHAPPLTPAHGLSRARAYFTGRAYATHAEFYWREGFGKILGYHRAGGGPLPIRDVIGLSPESLAWVRRKAWEKWELFKAGKLFAIPGKPSLQAPAARPTPAEALAIEHYTHAVFHTKRPETGASSPGPGDFVTGFRIFGQGPGKGKGKAKAAAKPTPPAALPKPPPRVIHPHVPDRIRKSGTWTEEQPDYLPPPPPPAPPPKPKPKKPATPRATWPKDPETLEVVRALGGSTGAELVKDASGKLFVRKKGKNAGHLKEETYADAAYQALGVPVPKFKLYDRPGGPVKLAEFHEGTTLADLERTDPAAADRAKAELRKHFVADALLGNWDVVGLSSDNILVTKAGQVLRIDNGGALRYRAQGALKPSSAWTGNVGELGTLRDPAINASAAKVFGAVTDQEVKAQAKALVKKRAKLLKALPPELRDVIGQRLDALKLIADAKPVKARKVKGFTPQPAADFKRFTDTSEMDLWGIMKYGKWAGNLTKEEEKAVAEYTGNGYKWMNHVTRTGTYTHRDTPSDHAKADAIIAALNRALRKGSLPEPIVTTRGIGSLADMGLDAKDLKFGDPIPFKGFSSTTTKQTPEFGKNAHFIFHLRSGSPGAYVNASPKSQHPGEKEFLLPEDAGTFRVLKVEKNGSVDVITVELIP